MSGTSILSVRISDHDRETLEKLADATGSNKSRLAAEAIRSYVEMNEWQTKVIRERLSAADRQEYASRERVKAVFEKWAGDAD